VPGCKVVYTGESQGDKRSYRVSFKKISERLPEFQPKWTMKTGAEQLYHFLKELNLTPEMFQGRKFVRLAQLQHLMDSGQVESDLLWAGAQKESMR
ncbi:MAG: NAD-dependent dehydratase, partial [bacterium]|nr:NAD-dependent dehydratase [bacterium]